MTRVEGVLEFDYDLGEYVKTADGREVTLTDLAGVNLRQPYPPTPRVRVTLEVLDG